MSKNLNTLTPEMLIYIKHIKDDCKVETMKDNNYLYIERGSEYYEDLFKQLNSTRKIRLFRNHFLSDSFKDLKLPKSNTGDITGIELWW